MFSRQGLGRTEGTSNHVEKQHQRDLIDGLGEVYLPNVIQAQVWKLGIGPPLARACGRRPRGVHDSPQH